MPHRDERSSMGAANAGNAVAGMYGSQSSPGNPALHHSAPPSMMHHHRLYNPVTPMNQQKSWLTASAANMTGIHRMIVQPALGGSPSKSADSSDRSMGSGQSGGNAGGSKPVEGDELTIATLATENTEREMASTLLMVSAGVNSKPESISLSESNATTPNRDAMRRGSTSPGTVPLKKRKHMGFMDQQQQTQQQGAEDESTSEDASSSKLSNLHTTATEAYHVSPVSQVSVGSGGRTISTEESTPSRPSNQSSAARSHSYDSKESPMADRDINATQALDASAKIHNSTEIGAPPPTNATQSHVPTLLHQVLSDEDASRGALQWLPSGEGWKVIRWDSLRRDVLPRFFSELCDENGKGCGTIDAFLWHIKAWGFDEIEEGEDIGSFKHPLFIRGALKLCGKMRFSGNAPVKGPTMVSPLRPPQGDRASLQVPSLATTMHAEAAMAMKRPRYEEPNNAASASMMHRQNPNAASWMVRPLEYTTVDNYGQQRYYSDVMRTPGGYMHHAYHDPRYSMPNQQQQPMDTMSHQQPQYATPRVRSGRGALRLPTSNRAAPTQPPAISRVSFPVSNRGKGRRPLVARSIDAPIDAQRSSPAPEIKTRASPTPVSGPEPTRSVAIAISRKTKRKLPLSRKSVSGSKSPTETK